MTILKGYIDNIDEVLVLVDKYGDNFIKMYNQYGNTVVTAYAKYGDRATFAFKNHSDDALDWLKKNYGETSLNSRTYKEGFDNHLINGTLGQGQKGVVGGHNYDEFKKVLTDAGFDVDDCIINIKNHPTIEGIYEVEYHIPARAYGPNGDLVVIPGQYKTIAYPKTVYDPSIISDAQMIQWGKEAMESGVVTGRVINGYSSNGLKFTGFIDDATGEITNFYPVLE